MNKFIYIFRHVLAPLSLIVLCPPAVMLFWYTNTHLGGSFLSLAHFFVDEGFLSALWQIWGPYFFGSKMAWLLIFSFMSFQLLLMKIVPGKKFLGPVTPRGNIPVYKSNGISCYSITLLTFALLSFKFKLFAPTLIYDHFGEILGAMTFFSLIFCLALYFKGRKYPSSTDAGSTGNFIFDYYWGTELYPRIFGFDVKLFTNCRFGMMSWGLILLSYGAKQAELYGLSDAMCVAIALQFIYITKFFMWETGYLKSLDIMHDRAGFYICWGCLVWVPCIYTSPTMYLVNHPNHLGPYLSFAILALGTLAILANYSADLQRQKIRALKGQCKIWGKKPTVIEAQYVCSQGEVKDSLLLASGFWGIARHFHYVPEIVGAFLWSAPALFTNFMPYFYVVFLTFLLLDRATRDDHRCLEKYGEYWKEYCRAVPYKILPYLY